MAELMIDPGMPRKVLRKAHQLGVHNDCLISQQPCKACHDNITLAFDFYYGDSKNEAELLERMIEDMRRDLLDDLTQDIEDGL